MPKDCSNCKFASIDYENDAFDGEGYMFITCQNKDSEFYSEYVVDACELFEENNE
jgi:hypothetical protein